MGEGLATREISDRLEIAKVLYTYVDARDWECLRACFVPGWMGQAQLAGKCSGSGVSTMSSALFQPSGGSVAMVASTRV